MCGLFGFHGTGRARAGPLALAIDGAQRRGPHGTGVYVDGALHRTLGQLVPEEAARELAGHRTVMGHARLATFGSYGDPDALQPVIDGDLVYAHNGNVYNWRELADRACPSDSFALRTLLRDARIASVRSRIDAPSIAITMRDSKGLYLYRERLPIHLHHAREGTYWCSWPLEGWMAIPEDTEVML